MFVRRPIYVCVYYVCVYVCMYVCILCMSEGIVWVKVLLKIGVELSGRNCPGEMSYTQEVEGLIVPAHIILCGTNRTR